MVIAVLIIGGLFFGILEYSAQNNIQNLNQMVTSIQAEPFVTHLGLFLGAQVGVILLAFFLYKRHQQRFYTDE